MVGARPIFSFNLEPLSLILWNMNTRIILAGFLGGVVMFVWNFVAHEFLPLGEMGVKTMANEETVTSALQTNLRGKAGFYIFPSGGYTPGMSGDERKAAMKKMEEQAASGAAGVLIYRPKRVFNFPKRLIIQFATDVSLAFLAVFLLSWTRITAFGGKVGFVFVAGILAAIATNLPYANWYGFPKDYTLGQMIELVVGFLLVGVVAGLMLRNQSEGAT